MILEQLWSDSWGFTLDQMEIISLDEMVSIVLLTPRSFVNSVDSIF